MGRPSWRLHGLAGNRTGLHAVTVQANWRLTFRFVGGDVELVDYLDYHRGLDMRMHNPAHPGELLAGWLEDLGVTVTAMATHLGISRIMLSRVLNGRSSVSADMDLRLSEALGTSPGYWLALQVQRDLWAAQKDAKGRRRIRRMAPPPA